MKKPSYVLVLFVSLALCACENQWMADLLQVKKITFESNGGSHVSSQKIMKGERVSEPKPPVFSGRSFEGWYTDNYTFMDLWNFNKSPDNDMTLYASWHGGQTPVAEDFFIDAAGTFLYDEEPKEVKVLSGEGKTAGKITVFYQLLLSGETYGKKKDTHPSAPGTYRVTFNVDASGDWNVAGELEAGTLVIYLNSAYGLDMFLTNFSPSYINNDPGINPSSPYIIPIRINNDTDLSDIASTLNEYNIYVTFDLSGSNIERIPNSAFFECSYLVGINIPNNVTVIGKEAFSLCINLADITIPSGVTTIENNAFYYCLALIRVTFQGTITSSYLSENAFGNPASQFGYIGDLRGKYLNGGPGTYTRESNGNTWTKR